MSEFKPSYTGIGALLRSEMVEKEMRRRAEIVKATAEQLAPVAKTGSHRGRYKASFVVSSGIRGDRACGRVVNTAPEAVFVEFGARGTPRYRTLGIALEAGRLG